MIDQQTRSMSSSSHAWPCCERSSSSSRPRRRASRDRRTGTRGLAVIAAVAVLKGWRFNWLIALPALWFDVGYFVAIDIPALGGTFGEAQTYIVNCGLIMCALATKHAYGDGWSNPPFEMTDAEFWVYLLCPILFQVVVLYTKANHVCGKGWHPLHEASESEGNELTTTSSSTA